MKCLIIDDEPLALTQLAGYIARIPFLTLVASCQDACQASEILAQSPVDLLFVDINMPDLNGIDLSARFQIRRWSSLLLLIRSMPSKGSASTPSIT